MSPKWATRSKPDSQHNSFTRLNELSPLKWDLIDLNAYQGRLARGMFEDSESKRRLVSVVSSRGCPFRCSFCAMHTVHGRTMHYLDVDKFLEEIKFLYNEYNINIIAMEDDIYNIDKKRAIDILEGIHKISDTIEVEFPSGFAPQLMDEEFIAVLMAYEQHD
jgi:radical SAM superfamily enzyme YgiQ (UPF0313 family)